MLDLSIIISTRNRAKSLAQSLQAIVELDISFDKVEVLVADNGSSDSTASVCQIYGKIIPHFSYIFDSRPGQLVGWHRALLESKAEILAFIDDDVRPMPNWANCVIESFGSRNIGMATGRIIPEFERRPPSWQNDMVLKNKLGIWSALWGMLDFGNEIREIPAEFVWGSNFLIRRQVMFKVGGFHPGGMPRDLYHFTGDGDVAVGGVISEMGFKALYHPGAVVAHHLPADRNSSIDEVKRWIFGEGLVSSYILMRKLAKAYPKYTSDELINLVPSIVSPLEVSSIGRGYLRADKKLPNKINKIFKTSGANGFNLHQGCFKNDKLFREWVLEPNYLDIDACYRHPDLLKDYESA